MPPSPLTRHLGFWLRAVSNAVSGAFAERLASRGVAVAEWVMLRTLYDAPLAPSRLAESMGMTRGAITKLADRLIAKGLVERRASLDDGRAQTLALTASGAALTPDLAALADANDAAFFGPLSAVEHDTLERLLKRVIEQANVRAMPID